MKYIYDLKELDKLGPAHLPAAQFATLIAIAERLEALVEAQKPTANLVELKLRRGSNVFINPKTVLEASVWHQEGFEDAVALITESCDREQGELVIVEGTLPEVLAKLRGDK